MDERARLAALLILAAIWAGCGGRMADAPRPLAAVLRDGRDWGMAVGGARMTGALLSAERVELGVVALAGGKERVACTEYEDVFIVHIGSGWMERGERILPEIHCRVLDSEGRPLRFLGIDPARFHMLGGGPTGIRWASPLPLAFSRAGRDLRGARVIVTTEEAEAAFEYSPAAAAPVGEERRPGTG